MAQLFCNFVSYSLGYGVDISITLPTLSSCDLGPDAKPCHTPRAPYPVLYLLHGHGNDYKCWLRYTSMERYAEERRIAVVTCSVGNKAYMNAAYGENYYDFVAYELPEFICGNFPVSRDPKDTYIAGLSMGGYGALAHGLSRPESFGAVGAFSPGIDMGSRQSTLGHELPPTINLYDQLDQDLDAGKKLPTLFLCCGQNDFLYQSVVAYHQHLESRSVPHVWDSLPGYEHEWAFWDLELPKFLDWLPRTDAYAGMPLHKL